MITLSLKIEYVGLSVHFQTPALCSAGWFSTFADITGISWKKCPNSIEIAVRAELFGKNGMYIVYAVAFEGVKNSV